MFYFLIAFFFVYCYGVHRDLHVLTHSFPTLRSSDLGAVVAVGHFADLVVIGDMAAQGERKVLQQVEGIARALDVMRSRRPLTTIVVGPRPVGKTLDRKSTRLNSSH